MSFFSLHNKRTKIIVSSTIEAISLRLNKSAKNRLEVVCGINTIFSFNTDNNKKDIKETKTNRQKDDAFVSASSKTNAECKKGNQYE